MHNSTQEMKACVELCWECRTECQETLYNHCLPMGGKHAEAEHVKLMTDCIQACQTAADFMVRGSKFHASECDACADVCEACAESCEKVGGEEMKKCAESFGQGLDLSSPNILQYLLNFASSVMTDVGATDMMTRIATLQAGRAKREASDAEKSALVFAAAPSYKNAANILSEINKQSGVRVYRPAILQAALKVLNACNSNNITPAEAAINVREQARLIGRPLAKRTVGSTLLLKGLESDVAVILDPSTMDRKHLYVAMTRGAKQLVICSHTNLI